MRDTEDPKKEEIKLRQLRTAVDLTKSIILQGDITYGEALKLVESLKSFTLQLFPDKEGVFELIYRSRLDRVIEEKYECKKTS